MNQINMLSGNFWVTKAKIVKAAFQLVFSLVIKSNALLHFLNYE